MAFSGRTAGFGAEVRSALDERRAFLIEEGLATRRGQRPILARDLLSTLRDRDVALAGPRTHSDPMPIPAFSCHGAAI